MSKPEPFEHLVLPDVLAVEDLVTHLRRSPAAIRAHLRAGNIPGRKIGRRWLVDREALLATLSPAAASERERPLLRLLREEGGDQ